MLWMCHTYLQVMQPDRTLHVLALDSDSLAPLSAILGRLKCL